MLLALGLPAVSTFGLSELRREVLREFCGAFGISRRGRPFGSAVPGAASVLPRIAEMEETLAPNTSPTSAEPHNLVLVGWSPAQFSLNVSGPAQVRGFLQDLGDKLGFGFGDFGWWQPSEDELSALALTLNMLDVNALRDEFVDAVEDCENLCCPPPPQAAAPPRNTGGKAPGTASPLNPLKAARDAARLKSLLRDQSSILQLAEIAQKNPDPHGKNLQMLVVKLSICANTLLEKHETQFRSDQRYETEKMDPAEIALLRLAIKELPVLTELAREASLTKPAARGFPHASPKTCR